MVGGGAGSAGTERARAARGRPNWWVVLAVSLALIAVLVATAGTTPPRLRTRALRAHANSDAQQRTTSQAPARRVPMSTTTSTAVPAPPTTTPPPAGTPSLVAAPASGRATSPGPGITTTTVAATTSTAAGQGGVQQPATRSTQSEGYLDPPLQTSQTFAFTGSGATRVSVVWSGTTYLTMVVSCPSASQSVGGTSAMQATLADAEGSCRATVSEPSSESTALTYTITIGPAGG